MTKNNKNEYLKNTIVLMLGKFCTQFISFLLVPLYTRRLDTADYGTIDLIHTYISLLAPLLILRLDSAVFRFLIDEREKDDEQNKRIIISNAIITISITALIFFMIYLFVPLFISLNYYWLICINTIAIMFSSIMLQIARGIGKTKDYSIASVITGITIAITNLILILGFNQGASSILVASSVGNVLCSIYLAFRIHLKDYFSPKHIRKKQLKTMLKYSIPMMPNAISWWIVNVSDRTIISLILGVAFNGIYTVSCKFSNLINSVFSIFNMSWQESASLHINDKNRDSYFSKMSNSIFILFMCIILIIISTLPILYNLIVGEEYSSSYIYIPILLIANLFHIAIQIFGGIYVAKKETKKIMNTTIMAAIINLVTNLTLVRQFGLFAACFSTLVAYASMAIYRYFDIKKYVSIKINFKKILSLSIILIVSIVAFYYQNIIICAALSAVSIIISILVNRTIIKSLFDLLRHKKQKPSAF